MSIWISILLAGFLISRSAAIDVLECFNKTDNGSSYFGRVTMPSCIPWNTTVSSNTGYYEDHTYCRNPSPEEVDQPYCFNGTDLQPEVCAVIACDIDCYTGNGTTYNGTGTEVWCLNWKVVDSPYANDFKEDHNYCRNPRPDAIVKPWCYTDAKYFAYETCNIPACEKIVTCPTLQLSANVILNPFKTVFYANEKVQIQCQKGYQTPISSIVCQGDGNWDHDSLIVCRGVPCPPLPDIINSITNTSHQYNYPESVLIICVSGYFVNGSSELQCNSDGQWNQPIPACIGVACDSFPDIKHSYVTFSQRETYRYPMNVTVSCETGYLLNGNETLKCDANGVWSTPPYCTGVPCPGITKVENRIHKPEKSVYSFPDLVTFQCEQGYSLSSNNVTSECTVEGNNVTGKWETEFPTCKVSVFNKKASSLTSVVPIVCGSLAAIIILILVAVLVFYNRRRGGKHKKSNTGGNARQNSTTNLYSNTSNIKADKYEDRNEDDHNYYEFDSNTKSKTAVVVDEFYEYVECGRSSKGKIETEFSLLNSGPQKPTTVAKLTANTQKNKYKNIHPYDETRVVLELLPDCPSSDYTNASFINGFAEIKQYIASQGPLGPTVDDWWRMVWQYDCGKIIMLTRVFEMGKHKCMKYWPDIDQKSVKFGNIEITIRHEDVFSDFTIRTLQLVQNNDTKTVKQCHFTAWPDKDVPKYASSLVHFRHKVNNMKCANKGPILVHCSAGIGRTGTYIALDYAVTEANQIGSVDIFRCVELLRRQRLNMVQTSRQYVFLHESVLEALICQNSGVPAAEFPDMFRQSLESENGKPKLEKDYEIMERMGHTHNKEVFEAGKSAENRTKNRNDNILPVISEMPALSTSVEGHNEYINAVFLPGYKNNKTFIITQMPLQNTVIDLWRLVWDYNIGIIVMLNQSYDQKEVYWPTSDQEKINVGPFTLELQEDEKHGVLSKKKIILRYKNGDQRGVKLLQSSFWPDEAMIPSSVDDFLYFITELEQEHDTQRDGPIVVHCANGCDKSGVYCVMATVIERLMIEQDVDIQNIIKQARNRRPQIIPTYVQYRFLHEVVIRYLQQFETYSNFQ